MSYEELVKFAEWMVTSGRDVHRHSVDKCGLWFEGHIEPEDVKAFNEHELLKEP